MNIGAIVMDVAELRVQGLLVARQIAGIFCSGVAVAESNVLIQAGAIARDVGAHASDTVVVVIQVAIVATHILTVVISVPRAPVLGHQR